MILESFKQTSIHSAFHGMTLRLSKKWSVLANAISHVKFVMMLGLHASTDCAPKQFCNMMEQMGQMMNRMFTGDGRNNVENASQAVDREECNNQTIIAFGIDEQPLVLQQPARCSNGSREAT